MTGRRVAEHSTIGLSLAPLEGQEGPRSRPGGGNRIDLSHPDSGIDGVERLFTRPRTE